MSIESVLRKELEIEQTRSERLEEEVITLTGIIRDFEENPIYPDSINTNIREIKTFLKQLHKQKSTNDAPLY
jgi:hypothetical protein